MIIDVHNDPDWYDDNLDRFLQNMTNRSYAVEVPGTYDQKH